VQVCGSPGASGHAACSSREMAAVLWRSEVLLGALHSVACIASLSMPYRGPSLRISDKAI
jgi:hypothetical protein